MNECTKVQRGRHPGGGGEMDDFGGTKSAHDFGPIWLSSDLRLMDFYSLQ